MRKFGLAVATVTIGWAMVCHAQTTAAGDWAGTLTTPAGSLHLVLHLQQGTDGKLAATLDSVDQGVNGIPASEVAQSGPKVDVAFAAAHASYAGTLSPDGSEMKGTWTQGSALPLDFVRKTGQSAAPPKVVGSDVDGVWAGTLDAGLMKLRIVFHLVTNDAGLTATMDSPDQDAKGIPVAVATRVGDTLKLDVQVAHAIYTGTISKDRTTITGTWTQGANDLPLELKTVKTDAAKQQVESARVRPQNPIPPYPYREENVSYQNKAQGDTLAGTLTIPPGNGPFTAVLLITGSGPQDRDEALLGHRPFLVLSDFLTRRGIEVLRVDDRGVGKSTGNFAAATSADFATDVEAGVAFLKTRPEVKKIGLIGHSEGGFIGPMVAARDKGVSFVVMMAGTGVPGYRVITEQAKLIGEAMGESKEKAEATEKKELGLYTTVLKDKDADAATLKKDLLAKLAENGKTSDADDALVEQVTTPWFRYFLTYDPGPALRQLRIPVLALAGSKDLQVPPEQNLPAIREELKNDPQALVIELPGLNHVFQTAKTGSPTEYQDIDETIAPVALKTIGDWVAAR